MLNSLRLIADEKLCMDCKEMKPASAFSPNKLNRSGLSSYCHSCRRTHRKAAYDPVKAREWHLQATYGISQAEYNAMLHAQGGVCAICKGAQVAALVGRGARSAAPLHVDHNHATGKVRGLLCNGCNGAIGDIREDPRIAEAIAAYLRKYGVP